MIKIGLIGGGLIATRHIEVFKDEGRCDLVAMLALGSENSRRTAANNGLAYTTDVETFFSLELDGVIICSPNNTHAKYLKYCMNKDIFALVEKPLFANYGEHEDFNNGDLNFLHNKVLVAHHRHHLAKYKKLKSILDGGAIGKPIVFHGFATWFKPDHYFVDGKWRMQKHQGGPIRINAIHDLLLISELCGELETVKVIKSNKCRGFDVEDTVAFSFETNLGVVGTFILSDCVSAPWSWEFTVHENKAYPYHEGDCYFIAGTKGSIQFPSLKMHSYASDPDWWSPMEFDKLSAEENDPFREQARNFFDMIAKGEQPLVSYSLALSTLKIMKEQIL